MTIGLTTLCINRPSFIHKRLRTRSDDGRNQAATANNTAATEVHGHMRPRCQPFMRLTTASAAAITNPNVRSEPGAVGSSRVKLSWVDCLTTGVVILRCIIRDPLSGVSQKVAAFLGPISDRLQCQARSHSGP